MGSRVGFEYRYCFWVDDEVFSRFKKWTKEYDDTTRFVFDIRTNFIVKGKSDDDADHEEIIESERFSIALLEYRDHEYDCFEVAVGHRLRDYWMSNDEIHEFLLEALTFATDPRHASHCPIVVIGINLDVCTVQRVGEPINSTIDRAIRPQYLFPIYLCPWYLYSRPTGIKEEDNPRQDELYQVESSLKLFLRDELHKVRVEDVDKGLSLMEECPICLRNSTIGAQISSLECGHTFHYHCIVQWLVYHNSCPMCRQEAYDDDVLDGDYELMKKFVY